MSPSPRRRRGLLAAAATCVLFAAPTAAQAADTVVTLPGAPSAGTPKSLDKVKVLKLGPASAKHVLVLEPGTSAGAPYFKPVATDILKRLPGWQVWSVERRENGLEDQSVLDQAKRGQVTTQGLFDYYLGWIGNSAAGKHFVPKATADVGYARKWGMAVAMDDLHRVVQSARKGGRQVVLGGHSLGGTMTTAYATWDFNGRAGGADLAGLVLIDGGSGPSTKARPVPTPAQAKASVASLAKEDPFLDLTGLGLSWSAGVFNAVGSTSVLKDPTGPSLLQSWAFLPANLKPPVPADNRGAYGFALDTETGPKSLSLVQQHIGHLATSGDPRDWVDGELGTVTRAASVFSGIIGMDGSSWYHPRRLSLDAGVVNNGLATPAQKVLGVRTTHGRDLDLPIYAFETSLGKGRVLKGARLLAKQSHISSKRLTLVSRSATYAHIDPLSASPEKNDFVKTVVPFLKMVGAAGGR
jgi:pimeloyl-ACP methyl ester carboxylesterase